jgi:rsbT antagonist protein RsbS
VRVPVLKQGAFLIASVQDGLTDNDLVKLREELADKVGEHRSRGVIIDVSALDVLDSFATRVLRNIAHATRLRGAETVVAGIQPDVAFAMVQLGLTDEPVATALDLGDGLELLRRIRGSDGRRAD